MHIPYPNSFPYLGTGAKMDPIANYSIHSSVPSVSTKPLPVLGEGWGQRP